MPVVEVTPEAPKPGSPARPAAREIVYAVALALAAFLATAGLLHAAIVNIRNPLYLHADVRSEKLEMLDQWRGKVFSAAFGTSHMHNGFDPRAFDATLAGSPFATRTASLAIEGGSQSEQFVMAEEFLKHLESPAQAGAPSQPCIVILELTAGVNFTAEHLVHPRAINIYDWRTTRLITHFTSPQMGAVQRDGRIAYALAAMGLHYANVGMLSNEIFAPPLSEKTLHDQTADDRRGLMEMPYHASYLPTMYAILARQPKSPTIAPEPTLRGNAEMIEDLAAISPPRHVAFVYVVMPKLIDFTSGADYPDHLTVHSADGPIDVPIINLARADRFPAIYDPQLWYDEAHLNARGAAMLSHLFAQQLKQWYATHGGPPPCQ